MDLVIADKLRKLEACGKIRNIAAQTCLSTLQRIIRDSHKVSEIKVSNIWLKELEKFYKKGFISCWYDPPPNGIAVLFGSEDDFERVNYPNLRPEIYWPKPDVFFRLDGLGYLFASSYTMVEDIPIIGDFGLSFYLGKTEKIKNHFKRSWEILNKLIDKIEIGISFREVYRESIDIIRKNNMDNFVTGYTDKESTDFGHTIPFIDRDPTDKEKNSINTGEENIIDQVISKARIFINESEEYRISENCAFTFEPRFISLSDRLPMCSFHTIVQFVDGEKVVLGNFEGIFNLIGMNWLRG